ncbi:MAG: carbohydrate-binding protein, partial [Anaerolineales bacterium]|nr:carbohydrate-binding protein [Anaerolineales bacterium]
STITVPHTGSGQQWQSVDATVTDAGGIHDLYLVFKGGSANLNWFRISPHFGSGSPHPGLPAVSYDYEMLSNRRNYNVAGISPMRMPRIDKLTTELGGEVDISYGQSHPCPVTPSPVIHMPYDCFMAWDNNPDNPSFAGWVVWQKYKVLQQQTSDAFSGNPTQTLTFDYSTPQWHYSNNPVLPEADECGGGGYPFPCATNHWNDYRGSKIVTVSDDSGAQNEYRFYTGMDDDRANIPGGNYNATITLSDGSTRTDSSWLAGQLAENRRLDSSDNALTKTVNWYTAVNTAGSGIYAAYFVAPQKTEETRYGTVDKTTRTEYEYDGYGNLTREILHGDIDTTNDDRNIETSYLYNTTAYIVNRPQWMKLWAGTTSGISGDEEALTQFAYDFQGVGFPPAVGNLTLERAFSQLLPTGITHDTAINYDPYGRPISVT